MHNADSTDGQAHSAWVFAGGEFDAGCFDPAWLADCDTVVGVDRGIAHCLKVGLVPDVMMGDFDSVDASILEDHRLVDVPRKTYSARKNSSDLELAMDWLAEIGVARVILLGVSGGRSDHHLLNWLLPSQERWQFAIEMIDATVHAHLVTPRHPLSVPATIGQTVTLVPVCSTSGVSTAGLEYALHDAHLPLGTTLGLSNVAVSRVIGVSVSDGRLLVFRVNVDNMLD